MIILIPLGGTGERFRNHNYTTPKALIKVFGKQIIFYLLDNLVNNIDKETMVLIPYNKEYENHRFEDLLRKEYPEVNFSFFCLKKQTQGALETILFSLKNIDSNDQPIICMDGDSFCTTDIIKLWDGKNIIFTIENKNTEPIFSYVKVDDKDNIIEIKEKNKISDYACIGSYGFESYKNLITHIENLISSGKRIKNEYYTSLVIDIMINKKINFKNKTIDSKFWNCLGTPIQVKHFYHNYPKVGSIDRKEIIKPKRFCFDLDNTLVTYPVISGDYTTVRPIQKNIDFLKYLKSFNNTIIIYTARRMKTHKGDTGKVLADIGKITFETIEEFNIPYDEIYFGKPQADFYIDDLGVNCFDDMEKLTGYNFEKFNIRDFNEIESNIIETFTKKSKDLSGEIYYYNNIPKQIKDLFPLLMKYDTNNTWYTIEKINGITLSEMYVDGLLTEGILTSVLESITRIQKTSISDDKNYNIYENYQNKLIERYENFDYSGFESSQKIFNELYDFFNNYEKNNKGKRKIIHGDPVFTNILINSNQKIKFIDMRGKLGKDLTLYGDYLYDWAKIYQSIIGYDEILHEKNVSKDYKIRMISVFENYFLKDNKQEDLDNLKMVTKLLLFTLIPLHNNEKCNKYYDLIQL